MSKLQSTSNDICSTAPISSEHYQVVNNEDIRMLDEYIMDDTRGRKSIADNNVSIISDNLTRVYSFLINYDIDNNLTLIKSINRKLKNK